jgi:hypothetical protein
MHMQQPVMQQPGIQQLGTQQLGMQQPMQASFMQQPVMQQPQAAMQQATQRREATPNGLTTQPPEPRDAEQKQRLDALNNMSKTERNARYAHFKRAMTTTNPARKPPADVLEAWSKACAAPGPATLWGHGSAHNR